ncbi:MAG: DUF3489 domain-containing protein [Rhodospirillales bacterium]|nr:DUF3489 domain-containing protein [Rhodospirillales bacterium]
MTDLTDAQLLFLTAAGQREPTLLVPPPKTFKGNKATATRVLNSLMKRGLAAERPAEEGEPLWREDDEQRLTLALTAAGRKAVGLEEATPAAATKKAAKATKAAKAEPTPPSERAVAKKGTKLALLSDLLRRKGGATIEEAVKATGWQPHSIRGAISGALKKKLGLAVASEPVEGRGRVYRIAARA